MRVIVLPTEQFYLLPSYDAEEVSAALLLSSRDVPFTESGRLHKWPAESDLIAGTDCLYTIRSGNARLANDLPMDL